jgi:3-methyladenine DNA glycosylase AlkC
MAGTLKTFFDDTLVRRLAGEVQRVHGAFPEAEFVRDACRGLNELELLERGRHIARALHRHLPGEYPRAVSVLLASLGPEHKDDELLGAGMAPFFYLPHTLFVAEHGLDHFDVSMRAQYELTKRFSAEGSIRPFIEREPERTFETLARWATDPNAHVRRLVSEGTRLRLPWAQRVDWLDKNPGRVVELLERLKDDPASLVRRSVANNLNDLARVHPALAVNTCRDWLKSAPHARRVLVEHALRGLVKRGDPGALRLLGFGGGPAVKLSGVRFKPARSSIGGRVEMSFALVSRATRVQNLLVDVAVHFVKKRGTSAKVFKLKRVQLAPKARHEFRTSFSLAVHTTRKPNPGRHRVDVIVNGQRLPAGTFTVIHRRNA